MTEQDKVQGEEEQKAPEQEEAQAPTPSAEGETTVEPSSEDVTEEEALKNAKNPERTKKYIEKLKKQTQEKGNFFDQFRPPQAENYDYLEQEKVDDISSGYVDEDGNVDIERLNQALDRANQQAQQAWQHTQQVSNQVSRYEESRQLAEAYADYPQLDPQHDKFDPDFYDLVSQRIMAVNYARGGAETVKQAAAKISTTYHRPNEKEIEKKAVEKYKETQESRQQGPIEKGKGEDRVETADLATLRERTRQGDDSATAERLKKLGI